MFQHVPVTNKRPRIDSPVADKKQEEEGKRIKLQYESTEPAQASTQGFFAPTDQSMAENNIRQAFTPTP